MVVHKQNWSNTILHIYSDSMNNYCCYCFCIWLPSQIAENFEHSNLLLTFIVAFSPLKKCSVAEKCFWNNHCLSSAQCCFSEVEFLISIDVLTYWREWHHFPTARDIITLDVFEKFKSHNRMMYSFSLLILKQF